MKPDVTLEHEFVDSVPSEMADNTLYVSVKYRTVIHKCCCGCGNKVVTPLKPSQWSLIFNGRSISLHPSVGCWSFPCRSHYWVRNNKAIWSTEWTEEEVAAGRDRDAMANEVFFRSPTAPAKVLEAESLPLKPVVSRKGRLSKLLNRLLGH